MLNFVRKLVFWYSVFTVFLRRRFPRLRKRTTRTIDYPKRSGAQPPRLRLHPIANAIPRPMRPEVAAIAYETALYQADLKHREKVRRIFGTPETPQPRGPLPPHAPTPSRGQLRRAQAKIAGLLAGLPQADADAMVRVAARAIRRGDDPLTVAANFQADLESLRAARASMPQDPGPAEISPLRIDPAKHPKMSLIKCKCGGDLHWVVNRGMICRSCGRTDFTGRG